MVKRTTKADPVVVTTAVKNIARGLGVPPQALARLWRESPPQDSWFMEGEDEDEAWSLTPPRESGDHVVGLKNIKRALGVTEERTVTRWLEKKSEYRSLLKPGGRYRVTRIALDNIWLFFHQGASRGKREGARGKARSAVGRFGKT